MANYFIGRYQVPKLLPQIWCTRLPKNNKKIEQRFHIDQLQFQKSVSIFYNLKLHWVQLNQFFTQSLQSKSGWITKLSSLPTIWNLNLMLIKQLSYFSPKFVLNSFSFVRSKSGKLKWKPREKLV